MRADNICADEALQLFVNPQQTIVFCGAFSTGGRTCFYKSRVKGNGQVGDESVLGLTASVGDYSVKAVSAGDPHCFHCLAESAYLVELDEDRVSAAVLNALDKPLCVGDKKVVAHQTHLSAQSSCYILPVEPVLLVKSGFDLEILVLGL